MSPGTRKRPLSAEALPGHRDQAVLDRPGNPNRPVAAEIQHRARRPATDVDQLHQRPAVEAIAIGEQPSIRGKDSTEAVHERAQATGNRAERPRINQRQAIACPVRPIE